MPVEVQHEPRRSTSTVASATSGPHVVQVAEEVLGEIGEGPRWDAVAEELTWVDIAGGCLYATTAAGTRRLWQTDALLGCTVRHVDGSVLGAVPSGIVRWRPGQAAEPVAALPGPVRQLNDGKCDSRGRFWVGAVGDAEDDGALLCVDLDGSVTVRAGGYHLPNGMDWFADGRTMLHADSYAHRIYAYDFDPERGLLGDRRVWWQGTAADGLPDGLCVDDEDRVWVAFWGAGCVRRYTPDAELLDELRFPVSQPSSVAFSGARAEVLTVTSAWADLAPAQRRAEPLAGAVFFADVGSRGRAVHDCAVSWAEGRAGSDTGPRARHG